jgi:KaiC/GvpD/RAD55 family RecA-like ATPase
MASTGLEQLDKLLGGESYPDKSAILEVGPAGIGKEALGYWFTRSGLLQGDFCVYLTGICFILNAKRRNLRFFG